MTRTRVESSIFFTTRSWVTITAHFIFVFFILCHQAVLCLHGGSDSLLFPEHREREKEKKERGKTAETKQATVWRSSVSLSPPHVSLWEEFDIDWILHTSTLTCHTNPPHVVSIQTHGFTLHHNLLMFGLFPSLMAHSFLSYPLPFQTQCSILIYAQYLCGNEAWDSWKFLEISFI